MIHIYITVFLSYMKTFLQFGQSLFSMLDLFECPNLGALLYPLDYCRCMSSMEQVYQKVRDNMKEIQHKYAKIRKL